MSTQVAMRKRHWLKECDKALERALKAAISEGTAIEDLYLQAAGMAAESRKVTVSDTIQIMSDYVQELVQQDYNVDRESRSQYKFHFVSSYIYAHVPVGLVDEFDAEEILAYLCDNLDLFDHDA